MEIVNYQIRPAATIGDYINIARPDHWFKNVFVLPGVVIAALLTHTPVEQFVVPLIIGLIATCLVASSNYVINEWLDAEFDRFHPRKRNRPSVTKNLNKSLVYTEYIILAVAGLVLGLLVSPYFALMLACLFIQGVFYNISPFRTKEKAFLDVLSEAVNNPIRLMLGWFIVTVTPLPPSSVVVGYWMGGAFLMAMKRYAEYCFINDPEAASLYRRSFKIYTKETLLISTFFYGLCSALFFGVFMVKHRIELFFSLPFFALLFAWYLHIGMKPDSPAQRPESLYTERGFIFFVILVTIIVNVLLFVDIPWLDWFLINAFAE
jgi:4-hydroxybenzoate polyprenyltransferase